MNQLSIDEIAQTLCRASTFESDECLFCNKGRCDYKMWTTFRTEAKAVYILLEKKNIIGKKKLLPGLGG